MGGWEVAGWRLGKLTWGGQEGGAVQEGEKCHMFLQGAARPPFNAANADLDHAAVLSCSSR